MNKSLIKSPLTKQVLLLAGNCLLILTCVYCTFGAIVSAFAFDVNMVALFWIWLFVALIMSLAAMTYREKGILILLVPSLLLLLLNITEIIEGAGFVIYSITDSYSRWLPITVLFQDYRDILDDPTAFFAAAGIVVTFLLAFAVCLYRSVFLTILSTAPIVFLTFIITDLQAGTTYLFGLIAVYLTLLISSSYSPDDYAKRGLAFIPSFTLAVLIMIVAYMISPQSTYSRGANLVALGNQFRTVASQMGRFGQLWQTLPAGFSGFGWMESSNGIVWYFNTEDVRIADAGGRIITNQSLLEVNANYAGTYYLRGYSMQNFNGRSWSESDTTLSQQEIDAARAWRDTLYRDSDQSFDDFPLIDVTRTMPAFIADYYSVVFPERAPMIVEMTINRTGDITPNVTYQPYYGGVRIDGNEALPTTESFFYLEESVHNLVRALDNQGFPMDGFLGSYIDQARLHAQYTQVDFFTAAELRRLATEAGINPDADRAAVADAVANYIMASGSYTLVPQRIPDHEDFVLSFLKDTQEGYCIHFATAAVLMLRALDIPARFTSGYVVTIPDGYAGRNVVVTDRNAHAWVEVFYEDIGWLYLEVTPGTTISGIPDMQPHSPTNTPQTPTPPTPTPPPQEPDEVDLPRPDVDLPTENELSQQGDGAGNEGRPGVVQQRFDLPQWVIEFGNIIIVVAACMVILIIRRVLVKKNRAKNLNQSGTNEAVIYTWRYIVQLSRKKSIPSADIEELALKARFSQHRLTEEERTQVIKYAENYAIKIYNDAKLSDRFWLKYIRALY